MTEQELRQQVVSIISGWEGSKRGSVGHYEILSIYNGYKPLPRGYAVKVTDAWCAATVSATWIRAGIAEYTGTECSCSRLIEIAKSKGWWVESDSYTPKLGDAVLYDWDDGPGYASKDDTGAPEHIGLVIKTGMGAFTVMEGNKGGAVGRREMAVNGRFIRGFICPDYAGIARAITAKEADKVTIGEIAAAHEDRPARRFDRIADMPEWARNDIKSLVDHGVLRGGGGPRDFDGRPADLDLSEDMIRTLVLCKRMIEAFR